MKQRMLLLCISQYQLSNGNQRGTSDPFYWHGLTLILAAWISNHVYKKLGDEIIMQSQTSTIASSKFWKG